MGELRILFAAYGLSKQDHVFFGEFVSEDVGCAQSRAVHEIFMG